MDLISALTQLRGASSVSKCHCCLW